MILPIVILPWAVWMAYELVREFRRRSLAPDPPPTRLVDRFDGVWLWDGDHDETDETADGGRA